MLEGHEEKNPAVPADGPDDMVRSASRGVGAFEQGGIAVVRAQQRLEIGAGMVGKVSRLWPVKPHSITALHRRSTLIPE